MIVISDTSPIANLAVVGQLDLLRHLYSQVLVPPAVFTEIKRIGSDHPAVRAIESSAWIITRPAANQTVVASLKLELDEGEAEAIALALELPADLLLLDERKGRMIAARLGLKFIGLLGVLIAAKQGGWLAQVKSVVDDLRNRAGFWMSDELYAEVIRFANE
jgi:hypothetical protein